MNECKRPLSQFPIGSHEPNNKRTFITPQLFG